MSLRLKFGVLLALLGLAVTLTLGTSWWAFSTLQSEIREPFRSMSVVLVALGEAKHAVESQRTIIRATIDSIEDAPPATTSATARDRALREFDLAGRAAEDSLRLIDVADWNIRSGTSSLSNLNTRIAAAARLGREYLALRYAPNGPSSPVAEQLKRAAHAARAELDALHDLIERMEGRVVSETTEALRFDTELRSWILLVLGLAFAIVVLACLQGIVLIRRWVLRPVAELRAAAAKISAGDFAHRIILPLDARPDELHQLSAEVNHMAGMVKSMQDDRVERERLAALGEMVRRLAHNLRNPLAGIRGLAEITRTDLKNLGPEGNELTENQTRIITAVDLFEKWLNELLGATRPMTIEPEPTEVARWLTGLVDAHRPMAQTRGVDLSLDTTDSPSTAMFDSRHLEHALSAMLSNAIEATCSPQARGTNSSGGSVRLKVDAAGSGPLDVKMGKVWTISITDEGTGVPPNLRESIFRPYFTTKRDGNGIGLAVALSVVKAHGGQIVVESPWPPRENGFSAAPIAKHWPAGARFTIYLPVERPDMANNGVAGLANDGQSGAVGGQDPRHRR